ncbi:hypothetical protein [Bacillus gobiensis]
MRWENDIRTMTEEYHCKDPAIGVYIYVLTIVRSEVVHRLQQLGL